MLLTQALQPLGCDDDDPSDEKPPEFDLEFDPKVWWSMSTCMQQESAGVIYTNINNYGVQ